MAELIDNIKSEILNFLKDINFMYNDCSMYDSVKRMLDELEADIRAKAIDEFAEKLKADFMDYDLYFIIHANNLMKPDEAFQSVRNMIDDVAEQLKEG